MTGRKGERMAQAQQSMHAAQVGRVVSAERENTLGLGQRELDILLDRLEAMDKSGPSSSKRGFLRWPFRRASVLLKIIHPGGTEVALKLACRNISKGGMALLHSAFVHPGSHCVVSLPKRNNTIGEVKGVICRCIHRAGKLHELGIQFAQAVDLTEYIDPRSADGGELATIEHVVPQKLGGRLLCADGNATTTRELQHALRETRVQLVTVRTGSEAIATLSADGGSAVFEGIAVASTLPDMTGVQLAREIRAAGIMTPIVLFADPVENLGVETLPAALSTLPLPMDEQALLRRLAHILPFNVPPVAGTMRRSA